MSDYVVTASTAGTGWLNRQRTAFVEVMGVEAPPTPPPPASNLFAHSPFPPHTIFLLPFIIIRNTHDHHVCSKAKINNKTKSPGEIAATRTQWWVLVRRVGEAGHALPFSTPSTLDV